MWHLNLCLRILDRQGYRVAAAYVSTAIDALSCKALSDGEISEMDLKTEERFWLVVAFFDKHGKIDSSMTDPPEGE